MGMAIVRRRVVGYAKLKRKRPAPPPRREASEAMVGEAAKPSRPFAAPKPPPPASWWQKAWKPAAVSIGALLAIGLTLLVAGSPAGSRASASYADTASSAPGNLPRKGGGHKFDYPAVAAAGESASPSGRALQTDESFLASAYVRKKPVAPRASASGDCVVKGGGSRDVAECLRRQGG